jgi:HAD superfamily hydrolase (TIGR01549 family)
MRGLGFDLDGTLIDSVYAHVFAWQRALAEAGLAVDGWRIHRRIGMSGGLFNRAVAREIGRPLRLEEVEAIQARHAEIFQALLPERRPLPGAVELLAELRDNAIPHGIATSGRRPEIDRSLEALGVGRETVVVARGDVPRAKREPDLFLACRELLGLAAAECYGVGDAVWDLLAARRARMLSIGLLSGGYGEDELARAGAFRVYRDADELRTSLDELGLAPPVHLGSAEGQKPCPADDNMPPSIEPVDDKRLQAHVIHELKWDPRIDEARIGVFVRNGAVTLTGRVSSYAEQLAAVEAAERVDGVRAVADELEVDLPDVDVRDDSEIAKAITQSLRWNVRVPDTIRVEVREGQVQLLGDVHQEFQRKAAERAVRHVKGVRSVMNLIAVRRSERQPEPFEIARSGSGTQSAAPPRSTLDGSGPI